MLQLYDDLTSGTACGVELCLLQSLRWWCRVAVGGGLRLPYKQTNRRPHPHARQLASAKEKLCFCISCFKHVFPRVCVCVVDIPLFQLETTARMFLPLAILYLLESRFYTWSQNFAGVLLKPNTSTRFASAIGKLLIAFKWIRIGAFAAHTPAVAMSFIFDINAVNIASVALNLAMWLFLLAIAIIIFCMALYRNASIKYTKSDGEIELASVRLKYRLHNFISLQTRCSCSNAAVIHEFVSKCTPHFFFRRREHMASPYVSGRPPARSACTLKAPPPEMGSMPLTNSKIH